MIVFFRRPTTPVNASDIRRLFHIRVVSGEWGLVIFSWFKFLVSIFDFVRSPYVDRFVVLATNIIERSRPLQHMQRGLDTIRNADFAVIIVDVRQVVALDDDINSEIFFEFMH